MITTFAMQYEKNVGTCIYEVLYIKLYKNLQKRKTKKILINNNKNK